MEKVISLARRPAVTYIALAFILAVGTLLRTASLGDVGVPGDELEVMRIATSGTSAKTIMDGEIKSSMSNLLPAMVKSVADTTGAGVNRLTLRVPGVTLGVAGILLVFMCGRLLAGAGCGLLAAILLALNATHIQCSREIYPYILSATGASAVLWALLSSATHSGPGWALKVVWLLLVGVGSYVTMGASLAAYPVAVVAGGLFGLEQIRIALKRRSYVGWVVASLLVLALTVGPKLWAHVARTLDRGTSKHGRADAYGNVPLFDPLGMEFLTRFAWGTGIFAIVALCVCLAGLILWFSRMHSRRGVVYVLVFIVLGFVATMVGRYMSGNPFYTRFLAPIMPAYVLLVSAGLFGACRWVASRDRLPAARRAVAGFLPALFGVMLAIEPALLSAEMRGRPTPYAQIVDWADATLPGGTPVLCDRYFDAWNEFVYNPATNVSFMSTLPNEPMERYQQLKWRETAQKFFAHNPGAAFYETKMYWRQLGPWEWPHTHFARKQVFVDESFMRLREMGLNYRAVGGKGYPDAWLSKTIYYNTLDDLKAQARKAGRPVVTLFGRGWGYQKAGRDMADWRVLKQEANIDLHSIAPAALEVGVYLVAVAVGKDKIVSVDGTAVAFKANQLSAVKLTETALQPGDNTLTLRDAGFAAQQVPLFVQQIVLQRPDATAKKNQDARTP